MKGLFLENIYIWMYKKDELRGQERREYIEKLESALKHDISKNFNYSIDRIEFKRESTNFTAYTIDNDKLFFYFNRHDNTCQISINHKFELTFKLDTNKINKALNN